MADKRNQLILSDGTKLWAGHPKKGSDDRDSWNYHFFKVYESIDDEDPIWMLGFYLSGTVASMWGAGDQTKLDKTLCDAMRLALPYIELPITRKDLEDKTGSRFITIGLLSYDQKPAFDKANKKITISGYSSPEEFIKQTVFEGTITDEKIKKFILEYANTERLINEMGDGRFMSLNIVNELFLPEKAVSRCLTELIDDGYIEPMGKKTLAGFTPFSKLTLLGRQSIMESVTEPTEVSVVSAPQSSYASLELIKKLELLDQKPLFTRKLTTLLDELNVAYESNMVYACHALLRAVLDHVPPIFGSKDFNAVADNYSWGRTDKAHMKALKDFRNSADDALHKQIRKTDVLLELQGIPNHRALNVLLNEAVELIEGMTTPTSTS